MVLYHCLGAMSQQQHGTWFPLADAGGFRGGGSCLYACGHPFALILGHSSSFRESWIVVGLGVSHHVVSSLFEVMVVWCLLWSCHFVFCWWVRL